MNTQTFLDTKSNEQKSKKESFILKESEKIKNENTEMDNKEVKKLAQNNWNHLSNQQRKEIAEELTVCKDSESNRAIWKRAQNHN